MVFLIEVPQRFRYSARGVFLSMGADIISEGYTQGSTNWGMIISADCDEKGMRNAFSNEYPANWCSVRRWEGAY